MKTDQMIEGIISIMEKSKFQKIYIRYALVGFVIFAGILALAQAREHPIGEIILLSIFVFGGLPVIIQRVYRKGFEDGQAALQGSPPAAATGVSVPG